ncbi:hypothetical protein SKAU_G00317750 [Synaphobranchus kaupii]|uniref:Uncharacterized protein n=1 Tax=Synaphobranchus kaupii TaxID=118154 RepID=A0A9Q1ESZ3_SYNKA|nr:hypothetical protein SKAU_G00317750 [Synaphobranchus kaupii]
MVHLRLWFEICPTVYVRPYTDARSLGPQPAKYRGYPQHRMGLLPGPLQIFYKCVSTSPPPAPLRIDLSSHRSHPA